jgi:hypothetical protein
VPGTGAPCLDVTASRLERRVGIEAGRVEHQSVGSNAHRRDLAIGIPTVTLPQFL